MIFALPQLPSVCLLWAPLGIPFLGFGWGGRAAGPGHLRTQAEFGGQAPSPHLSGRCRARSAVLSVSSAVWRRLWESPGLQGDESSPSERKPTLGVHWKGWCWSCSSNTLATWCEEPTHWKRPWCWERLKAGGEGDNRGWDGWMASPTQWIWIWANTRR